MTKGCQQVDIGDQNNQWTTAISSPNSGNNQPERSVFSTCQIVADVYQSLRDFWVQNYYQRKFAETSACFNVRKHNEHVGFLSNKSFKQTPWCGWIVATSRLCHHRINWFHVGESLAKQTDSSEKICYKKSLPFIETSSSRKIVSTYIIIYLPSKTLLLDEPIGQSDNFFFGQPGCGVKLLTERSFRAPGASEQCDIADIAKIWSQNKHHIVVHGWISIS